jgi:hypothetical protein
MAAAKVQFDNRSRRHDQGAAQFVVRALQFLHRV